MCLADIWILGNNLDVHPYSCGCKCRFKAWNDGAVTVLLPHIAKNCSKIFAGDVEELKRVNSKTAKWKNSSSDHAFFDMTMKCFWVRCYFGNNFYVTKLERFSNSFIISFA